MATRLSGCLLVVLGAALAAIPAQAVSRMEASRDLTAGVRAQRPRHILIYNFDASLPRTELRLSGLNAAAVDASTPEQKAQAGRRAANFLADALWKALQARGAPAQRATRETSVPKGALLVQGRVLSVDEGARSSGAPSTLAAMPVRVRVQFDAYQGSQRSPSLHWQGRVATTSKPLGASLLGAPGLGAAAGRMLGLPGSGSQTDPGQGDLVARYAAEMAEVIADDLWARFGKQGWVK